MSNRETILYETDEVEEGNMSIEDCEFPNEVEDELINPDFDSDGYVINHNIKGNNINYNNGHDSEKNSGHEKTCCGICLLIFLIFFIYSKITFNPIFL